MGFERTSGVRMYPFVGVFHKLCTYPKWVWPILLFTLSCTFFSSCSNGGDFDEYIQDLEPLSAQERQQRLDEYWHNISSFPLVADSVVWFFYKSDQPVSVFLSGDFNGWSKNATPFYNIVGTDVYYCRRTFPIDARIEYKLLVNGVWQTDSLNKRIARGGYGVNSVVYMPDYRFPTSVLPGHNTALTIPDTLTFGDGSDRETVYVYRHVRAANEAPCLVFLDGQDYLRYGSAGVILDNAVRNGDLPPVTAVFINTPDRMRAYWLNDNYLKHMMTRLLPDIWKSYGWRPRQKFVGGVSLGGLTALYALKDYSDEWAGVFAQSPSVWVDSLAIVGFLSDSNVGGQKVAVSMGKFERQERYIEKVKAALQARGARVSYFPVTDGHNWGNWRATLLPMLKNLLSTKE